MDIIEHDAMNQMLITGIAEHHLTAIDRIADGPTQAEGHVDHTGKAMPLGLDNLVQQGKVEITIEPARYITILRQRNTGNRCCGRGRRDQRHGQIDIERPGTVGIRTPGLNTQLATIPATGALQVVGCQCLPCLTGSAKIGEIEIY